MKQRTLLAWAATALAALAGILWAVQPGSISGTVSDTTTKLPLAGASLKLMGTAIYAKSNTAGNFTFASVPAGTYEVLATRPGYETAVVKNVKVESGKAVTVAVDRLLDATLEGYERAERPGAGVGRGPHAARDGSAR